MREKMKLAHKAMELANQLGDTIESLTNLGCIVTAEVYFNDGSESITLHRLNGELELEIGMYQSLTRSTEGQ